MWESGMGHVGKKNRIKVRTTLVKVRRVQIKRT